MERLSSHFVICAVHLYFPVALCQQHLTVSQEPNVQRKISYICAYLYIYITAVYTKNISYYRCVQNSVSLTAMYDIPLCTHVFFKILLVVFCLLNLVLTFIKLCHLNYSAKISLTTFKSRDLVHTKSVHSGNKRFCG